ncbi:MAG: DUF4956 domain-containing protein [Cuneatibacter sp.]|nr:DUF4956 domain-containing protein [Cuneatibacter sp.]
MSGALTVILRHNGYDIDPVYDGAKALSRLLQGGYDAAILDIMMPKMDGLSVLRNILANFLICMIILMVNGNLGAGVAVAGAFRLVRFRSAPGTAKEIGSLFLAMAVGLAVGMGYIGYAVLFALVTGLFLMLATALTERKPRAAKEKILRITIPEDLNYTDVFDDLMEKYTTRSEMTNVDSYFPDNT